MKFILTNFGDGFSIKSHHMNGVQKYGPHIHQFIEIGCVIEGKAIVTVDGIKKILHSGEFVIIHPFRLHWVESTEGCRMWLLVISDKIINDFGVYASQSIWGEDFAFTGSKSLVSYVIEHSPPESDEHMPIEYDSPMLFRIRALYCAIMEEYTRKVPQTKKESSSIALASIYKYIEQHYREDIKIKDVSHALGYSEKYISHTLAQVSGTNFRKILNQRRITTAKWLLLNDERKNIIEIALMVGFSQEKTFYRVFKEATGTTPFLYRKLYKK